MDLVRLEAVKPAREGAAVCLGTFDGVHAGHRELAGRTARAAREKGLLACAYTFDQPPVCVLLPGKTGEMLTDIGEKAALLATCGIQRVVYSVFDRTVAAMPAQWFFDYVLCRRLNAKHVVIGFHYRFGRQAEGDAALMRTLCERNGLSLEVVPPVCTPAGELISSTAIRRLLEAGDRAGAEQMLNRSLSERETLLLGGNVHE